MRSASVRKSVKAPPVERKCPPEPSPVKLFQADFKLKIAPKQDDKKVEGTQGTKLYALFKPKSPAPKPAETQKSRFPERFRNAFARKKNVNLFISQGLVMWDFAYDRTIIDAIKEHIPDRRWDPLLKKWTNPLESLPDAIALYEHMGRTPDGNLKKRSQEIMASCGGGNPNQVITLSVRLLNDGNNDNITSPGKVICKFMYNPKIIAAIKQLPPNQRSFDPLAKQWPIDLLALPSLLEHLEPLGYVACDKLVALRNACQAMVGILYGNTDTVIVTEGPTFGEIAPSTSATSMACHANDGGQVTIDLIEDWTEVPLCKENVPMMTPEPGDRGEKIVPADDSVEADAPICPQVVSSSLTTCESNDNGIIVLTDDSVKPDAPIGPKIESSLITPSNQVRSVNDNSSARAANSITAAASSLEPVEVNSMAKLLQAELKKVMTLLMTQNKEQNSDDINRSDCGEAKRRRLTLAQEMWGLNRSLGLYDDDDDFGFGYNDYSLFSTLASRLSSRTAPPPPVDCDCGRPWVLSGGRHICRYFGTFQCSCGNRWTSGYTWKGEMQACKSCNVESLPVMKEKLLTGGERGIGGGPHDSARCSRCRKLGYNCSIYY